MKALPMWGMIVTLLFLFCVILGVVPGRWI